MTHIVTRGHKVIFHALNSAYLCIEKPSALPISGEMNAQKDTLFDLETGRDRLVQRYRALTMQILPRLAQDTKQHWPVREDHCFQRIVLDTICRGVWYDHIQKPAYKYMTEQQAQNAVTLCEGIIEGTIDLGRLNAQSLAWRGKGT